MGANVATSSSTRHATRYALNLCGKRPKREPERTELPVLCGRATPDLCDAPKHREHEQASAYVRLRRLGEGAYGAVYEARHKATGEHVALKRMLHDGRSGDKEVTAETLREVQCLRRLRSSAPESRFVVQLLGVEQDRRGVSLMLELCDEDLRSAIKRNSCGLPVSRVKKYAKQLLTGVAFLHSRRILHRDLKPHNVLLDFEGDAKIADFGLARPLEQADHPTMTREVVTLWYRCPELLLGLRQYGGGVDTWSVGCIIAEMASGKPLFKGDCEIGQVMRIFEKLGTPTAETYPRYFELPYVSRNFPKFRAAALELPLATSLLAVVQGLLGVDPDQRLSARKALRSPCFGLEDAPRFPRLD